MPQIVHIGPVCTVGPLRFLEYRPAALCASAGPDSSDATSSQRPSEDFAAGLLPLDQLVSKPLAGRRLAVIQETTGEGVDSGKCAAGAVLPLQADPGSEPWLGTGANNLGGGQCIAAGAHQTTVREGRPTWCRGGWRTGCRSKPSAEPWCGSGPGADGLAVATGRRRARLRNAVCSRPTAHAPKPILP